MKRLSRYVLFELVGVFVAALTVMTGLMVVVGVGQEAVRQNLGLAPLVQLLPYVLPDALRFAVPGTILFAACVVYGRMSARSEVTAVKSLGISPLALVWPGLLLAFALSLTSVWLNDLAVTWGKQGVQRVVLQSVEEIVLRMLRTQRSYSTHGFAINVKGVEDNRLLRPMITFQQTGDAAVTVIAREAEIKRNLDQGTLSIFLTDGKVEVGDEVQLVFQDTIERAIPLTAATRKSMGSTSPSHVPLSRIDAEAQQQQEEIQRLRQMLAADATFDMLCGDFEALASPKYGDRLAELENAERRLCRLRTEPWRRWANGFSCLFFVLVGAPLAVRMRSGDFLSTFFLCFFPILLVYYPLLALGVDRAKSGDFPPYCVWLGNLLLFVVGVALIRRMKRY